MNFGSAIEWHGISTVLCACVAMAAALAFRSPSPARGDDITRTILFDGERSEGINTWGGPFGAGISRAVTITSQVVGHGRRAAKIDLGEVPRGESRTFAMFASGFARDPAYCQTRNLEGFQSIGLMMSNHTGAPLRVALEIRDYRDSDDHRALRWFVLDEDPRWRQESFPLTADLSSWQRIGHPDLGRVSSLRFLIQADDRAARGSVYLDDVTLVERGGPLSTDQAPLNSLVAQLARRGWDGLWSARSRQHGLIPSNSYQVTDAGLNTTAAVLWMLPAAVRRGWVRRTTSDDYVAGLLVTLDELLDRARYLPPRNVDWVNLRPSLLPEESSIDAAFLSLALHQYKSLPGRPAPLRAAIDRVQNRMRFDAFSRPSGWTMAYRYASPHQPADFVDLTYDGYTNENKIISLAAHLSRRHHVDIATHWNTDVYRVRAELVDSVTAPAVHRLRSYRAPFTQALLNLFVDVRDRGCDSFPDESMATNPWENFVAYQRQVMFELNRRGRPWLVQPDAGDDGTLSNYQQFSLYEDFGQSDLFMPWSVSFALLARVEGAENAFRFLLAHGLHGPLGFVDSARWATGDERPYAVTSRHDFWNTALATMAMLEYLDGNDRPSRRFAALPAVREALNRVFPADTRSDTPAVASARDSTRDIAPAGMSGN